MNTKITAQSIRGYVRYEHRLLISESLAEEIKALCDNQNTDTNEILKEITGKSAGTGDPIGCTISIAEMKNKIKKVYSNYQEVWFVKLTPVEIEKISW